MRYANLAPFARLTAGILALTLAPEAAPVRFLPGTDALRPSLEGTGLEQLQNRLDPAAGLEEPESYEEAARKARQRISPQLRGDHKRFPKREFFLVSPRGVSITKEEIARWSQDPWLSGVRVINPDPGMDSLAEISFLHILTKAEELNRLPPTVWPVNLMLHSPQPWNFYLRRRDTVEIWGIRIEERENAIILSPASSEDSIYLEVVEKVPQGADLSRLLGGPFRSHREAVEWLDREKVNLAETHGVETDFILLYFVPPAPVGWNRWQSLEDVDWPDRILELMRKYNPNPEARPYQVLFKTEWQFRGRGWVTVKVLVLALKEDGEKNLPPKDSGAILADEEGSVEYEGWVLRRNAVAGDWVPLSNAGLVLNLDDLSSGGIRLRRGTSPSVQWLLFWAKPHPMQLQRDPKRDAERPLPAVRVESSLGLDTAGVTGEITEPYGRLVIGDAFEVRYDDYENMRLQVSPISPAQIELQVRHLPWMVIRSLERKAPLQEAIYRNILGTLRESAPNRSSAEWNLREGKGDGPLALHNDPERGIRFFRSPLMMPPQGDDAHASLYGFFPRGTWNRQAVQRLFPMFGAIPTSVVLSRPSEIRRATRVHAQEDEEGFLVVTFAPEPVGRLMGALPLVAELIAAVSDSGAEETASGLEEWVLLSFS